MKANSWQSINVKNLANNIFIAITKSKLGFHILIFSPKMALEQGNFQDVMRILYKNNEYDY